MLMLKVQFLGKDELCTATVMVFPPDAKPPGQVEVYCHEMCLLDRFAAILQSLLVF